MNRPTIIYCATRATDIDEAEKSIASIRSIYSYKEQKIVIFTNVENYQNPEVNQINNLKGAKNNFSDKILTMLSIEDENILFLDGDTFITDNLDDFYSLLNSFDLSVTHAPNRWTLKLNDIPDSFPELNTGVILYKNNKLIKRFLQNWYDTFCDQLSQEMKIPSQDQPAFRSCLFNSDIRFNIFTPEYNCRFNMGVAVSSNVKILHGRHNDFSYVKEDINTYGTNPFGQLKNRWVKYSTKREPQENKGIIKV